MRQEDKRELIKQCVEDGDWSVAGDIITRNDLMEYMLFYTNPTLNPKSMKIAKVEPCDCALCGHPTKTQPFSLTKRTVMYLLCAIWLSEQDIAKGDKGNDGYVHYEVIHDLCQQKFLHDKGKKVGNGISFTSYSTLTRKPWDFLQSQVDTNYKPKRNGMFKPTQRCYDFLRGQVAVPLRIELLDSQVVRSSSKLIMAHAAKDINWSECLEIYKTF